MLQTCSRKDQSPPKGIPQDLLDRAETLRWIRSVLGESKSWPEGQLRQSFLDNVQNLSQSLILPSYDVQDKLQKELESAKDQIICLQRQIDQDRDQRPAPQPKVEVRTQVVREVNLKLTAVLTVVAFVIGLLLG